MRLKHLCYRIGSVSFKCSLGKRSFCVSLVTTLGKIFFLAFGLEFQSKRVRKECMRACVWVCVCKCRGFPTMGIWEQWSNFNPGFIFSELVAILYVSNRKDRNQPCVAHWFLLKTNGSKIYWETQGIRVCVAKPVLNMLTSSSSLLLDPAILPPSRLPIPVTIFLPLPPPSLWHRGELWANELLLSQVSAFLAWPPDPFFITVNLRQ